MAISLFLLLPLTQYFARPAADAPESRRIDIQSVPPPPPPPPPPEEVMPPSPAPTVADRVPDPARPEPPPLTLRQLQLALDADVNGVGQGDFAMDFSVSAGDLGGIDVFALSEVDQPPRPVSARPPRFPRDLQRAGIGGSVSLVFVVDRDGAVRDIRVESSDYRALEAPAIDAVRTWRFLPGEHQGQPARVMVRQTLQFEVQ